MNLFLTFAIQFPIKSKSRVRIDLPSIFLQMNMPFKLILHIFAAPTKIKFFKNVSHRNHKNFCITAKYIIFYVQLYILSSDIL